MKLNEYQVELTYYPWLPTITHFENWNSTLPTQTLPWYDAYNKTKHDRDEHFMMASLDNALSALTACFIVLCAQYGWDFALKGEDGTRAFFRLITAPTWPFAEIYIPGSPPTPKNYNFA